MRFGERTGTVCDLNRRLLVMEPEVSSMDFLFAVWNRCL